MSKESSREKLPMQRVMRQKEYIDKLNHENEVLRLGLTQEMRDTKKMTVLNSSSDVIKLQEQADQYIVKIEQERGEIEELDRKVAKLQEKISEQKQRMGGVSATQANNQMISRQIKALENRLDQNLIKFNEVLAENKTLRHKIDEHRKERVVFDSIYKSLEIELHQKKKELSTIIEESKSAYYLRDLAYTELQALKQQTLKEKTSYDSEFRELGVIIKQERLMMEQLRVRHFEADKETNPPNTAESSVVQLRTMSSMESVPLSSIPSSQEMRDNVAPVSLPTEFENIMTSSNSTESMDELVTKFLDAEEKNFSLFNYVNELNCEIEKLENLIHSQEMMMEYSRGEGESNDALKRRAIRDLDEKLVKINNRIEEYNHRHQQASRFMSQLRNGVTSIYTRIAITSTNIDDMFGNQGITDSNIMLYLGLIEQRISEIASCWQLSSSSSSSTMLSVLHPARMDEMNLEVIAPSCEDLPGNEDDDHTNDRPLTRQELDKIARKRIDIY